MFSKKRKCPKCLKKRPVDWFSTEWCDECLSDNTDSIMALSGYVLLYIRQDLLDDAEETWEKAWGLVLSLPRDYPDYAELCDFVSDICPIGKCED